MEPTIPSNGSHRNSVTGPACSFPSGSPLLFLLFLLLQTLLLESQSYHPLVDDGKKWSTIHQESIMNPPTSDYIKFEGDTLIAPYTYKHAWQYLDAAMTQKYLEGFIREDIGQQRVFFRFSDIAAEFLLYDFNAMPGDTLSLHFNPYPYVLDSIGTYALLTGEQRRSLYLHSAVYTFCTETWVEGIGSITKGVLNSGTCGYVGDDPKMLCAWENDSLKYHHPGYSTCFTITGMDEVHQKKQRIAVSPNPASDEVTIRLADDLAGPVHMELLEFSGRIIFSQDLVTRKTTLDLKKHSIHPGIYLIRLFSGTEILTTGKLAIL